MLIGHLLSDAQLLDNLVENLLHQVQRLRDFRELSLDPSNQAAFEMPFDEVVGRMETFNEVIGGFEEEVHQELTKLTAAVKEMIQLVSLPSLLTIHSNHVIRSSV